MPKTYKFSDLGDIKKVDFPDDMTEEEIGVAIEGFYDFYGKSQQTQPTQQQQQQPTYTGVGDLAPTQPIQPALGTAYNTDSVEPITPPGFPSVPAPSSKTQLYYPSLAPSTTPVAEPKTAGELFRRKVGLPEGTPARVEVEQLVSEGMTKEAAEEEVYKRGGGHLGEFLRVVPGGVASGATLGLSDEALTEAADTQTTVGALARPFFEFAGSILGPVAPFKIIGKGVKAGTSIVKGLKTPGLAKDIADTGLTVGVYSAASSGVEAAAGTPFGEEGPNLKIPVKAFLDTAVKSGAVGTAMGAMFPIGHHFIPGKGIKDTILRVGIGSALVDMVGAFTSGRGYSTIDDVAEAVKKGEVDNSEFGHLVFSHILNVVFFAVHPRKLIEAKNVTPKQKEALVEYGRQVEREQIDVKVLESIAKDLGIKELTPEQRVKLKVILESMGKEEPITSEAVTEAVMDKTVSDFIDSTLGMNIKNETTSFVKKPPKKHQEEVIPKDPPLKSEIKHDPNFPLFEKVVERPKPEELVEGQLDLIVELKAELGKLEKEEVEYSTKLDVIERKGIEFIPEAAKKLWSEAISKPEREWIERYTKETKLPRGKVIDLVKKARFLNELDRVIKEKIKDTTLVGPEQSKLILRVYNHLGLPNVEKAPIIKRVIELQDLAATHFTKKKGSYYKTQSRSLSKRAGTGVPTKALGKDFIKNLVEARMEKEGLSSLTKEELKLGKRQANQDMKELKTGGVKVVEVIAEAYSKSPEASTLSKKELKQLRKEQETLSDSKVKVATKIIEVNDKIAAAEIDKTNAEKVVEQVRIREQELEQESYESIPNPQDALESLSGFEWQKELFLGQSKQRETEISSFEKLLDAPGSPEYNVVVPEYFVDKGSKEVVRQFKKTSINRIEQEKLQLTSPQKIEKFLTAIETFVVDKSAAALNEIKKHLPAHARALEIKAKVNQGNNAAVNHMMTEFGANFGSEAGLPLKKLPLSGHTALGNVILAIRMAAVSKADPNSQVYAKEAKRYKETVLDNLSTDQMPGAKQGVTTKDYFLGVAKEYFTAMKENTIDQSLRGGILSRELYDKVKDFPYFPFNATMFIGGKRVRVGDFLDNPDIVGITGSKTPGGTGEITVSGLPRLKEGFLDAPSIDFMGELRTHIMRTKRAQQKNDLIKDFNQSSILYPGNGIAKQVPKGGGKRFSGWTLAKFKDINAEGKVETKEVLIRDDIASDLFGVDPYHIDKSLMSAISYATGVKTMKFFTTGAGRPIWWLYAFPRDVVHAYLATDHRKFSRAPDGSKVPNPNFTPYSSFVPRGILQVAKDAVSILPDVLGRKGVYKDYLIEGNGGFQGNVSHASLLPAYNRIRQVITEKGGVKKARFNRWDRVVDFASTLEKMLNYMSNSMEYAIRVGMYKRLVDKGVPKAEAGHMARSIMEFDTTGTHSSFMDIAFVAYFRTTVAATKPLLGQLSPFELTKEGYKITKEAKSRSTAKSLEYTQVLASSALVGYLSYNLFGDKLDNIPSYIKRNFAVLLLSADKHFPGLTKQNENGDTVTGYAKLPLDQSIRPVWHIGQIIGKKAAGYKVTEDEAFSAYKTAISLITATPFTPSSPLVNTLFTWIFEADAGLSLLTGEPVGVPVPGHIEPHLRVNRPGTGGAPSHPAFFALSKLQKDGYIPKNMIDPQKVSYGIDQYTGRGGTFGPFVSHAAAKIIDYMTPTEAQNASTDTLAAYTDRYLKLNKASGRGPLSKVLKPFIGWTVPNLQEYKLLSKAKDAVESRRFNQRGHLTEIMSAIHLPGATQGDIDNALELSKRYIENEVDPLNRDRMKDLVSSALKVKGLDNWKFWVSLSHQDNETKAAMVVGKINKKRMDEGIDTKENLEALIISELKDLEEVSKILKDTRYHRITTKGFKDNLKIKLDLFIEGLDL